MKKGIFITIGSGWSFLILAQENTEDSKVIQSHGSTQQLIDPVGQGILVETVLAMTLVGLLVFAAISLVKYYLDYRLKNKLIDRGGAEHLTSLRHQASDSEKKNEALRSAILFCGLGTGLLITYLTLPAGIHSVAIMAFSIGLSYLIYFFYLTKSAS